MTASMIVAWAFVALVAYWTSPLWIPLLLLILGAISFAALFVLAWVYDKTIGKFKATRRRKAFQKRIGK